MMRNVEFECSDKVKKCLDTYMSDKFVSGLGEYDVKRPSRWLGYIAVLFSDQCREVFRYCEADAFVNDVALTERGFRLQYYCNRDTCFTFFKKLMLCSELKSFIIYK